MDYQPEELGESPEVAAIDNKHGHLGLIQIMRGSKLDRVPSLVAQEYENLTPPLSHVSH